MPGTTLGYIQLHSATFPFFSYIRLHSTTISFLSYIRLHSPTLYIAKAMVGYFFYIFLFPKMRSRTSRQLVCREQQKRQSRSPAFLLLYLTFFRFFPVSSVVSIRVILHVPSFAWDLTGLPFRIRSTVHDRSACRPPYGIGSRASRVRCRTRKI